VHIKRYVSAAPIIIILLPVLMGGYLMMYLTHQVASNNKNQRHHANSGVAANGISRSSNDVFTLTATSIVGQDARLMLLSNPLEPTLVFSSSTISGLSISHPLTANTTLVISATGPVTATGVSIKTSVLNELKTSLSSSVNPADLLILLAGGTVHTLVMKNVNLKIDRFIQSQTQDLAGFHLTVVSG
jgi:hypothetical protein